MVDVPFKRIAVDLIGPLKPTSKGGFRYVLTVIDVATRFPEAVPLKNIHYFGGRGASFNLCKSQLSCGDFV